MVTSSSTSPCQSAGGPHTHLHTYTHTQRSSAVSDFCSVFLCFFISTSFFFDLYFLLMCVCVSLCCLHHIARSDVPHLSLGRVRSFWSHMCADVLQLLWFPPETQLSGPCQLSCSVLPVICPLRPCPGTEDAPLSGPPTGSELWF